MRLHQMVTFSALLAFCAGDSPVTGEFPTQRPMTRSFDVSFHSRLNQHLNKQCGRQWFEAPWRSLKLICLNQLDLPSVQWHIAARSRHQLCDGFWVPKDSIHERKALGYVVNCGGNGNKPVLLVQVCTTWPELVDICSKLFKLNQYFAYVCMFVVSIDIRWRAIEVGCN